MANNMYLLCGRRADASKADYSWIGASSGNNGFTIPDVGGTITATQFAPFVGQAAIWAPGSGGPPTNELGNVAGLDGGIFDAYLHPFDPIFHAQVWREVDNAFTMLASGNSFIAFNRGDAFVNYGLVQYAILSCDTANNVFEHSDAHISREWAWRRWGIVGVGALTVKFIGTRADARQYILDHPL